MNIKELIEKLEKFPKDTKVLIQCLDCGIADLEEGGIVEDVIFSIWHSDYNNNKTPYIGYDFEPRDFVYHRGGSLPDYECKTVEKETVVILR